MTKRIIQISLCLTMILILASCGRKEVDNHFTGEWYCGKVEQISDNSFTGKEEIIDVTQAAGTESTITVKDNGTVKIMLRSDFANETISGNWEYSEENPDRLMVRVDGGNDLLLHAGSEGTIYLDDGAEVVINRYHFWKNE